MLIIAQFRVRTVGENTKAKNKPFGASIRCVLARKTCTLTGISYHRKFMDIRLSGMAQWLYIDTSKVTHDRNYSFQEQRQETREVLDL